MTLEALLPILSRDRLQDLAGKQGLPMQREAPELLGCLLLEPACTLTYVLRSLKKSELKTGCRALGLPVSGSKQVLLTRLEHHCRANSYLEFTEARRAVRALELRGTDDWERLLKGKLNGLKLPQGVPATPQAVYRGRGWRSFPDFLGPGPRYPEEELGEFWDFEQCRTYARSLGLPDYRSWREYCRGDMRVTKGTRPRCLHSNPNRAFSSQWEGWSDFLGNSPMRAKGVHRRWLPFAEARDFVHGLGLSGEHAWRSWLRGKRYDLPPRPSSIPAAPDRIYEESGWLGWGDWVGTGTPHWSEWEYWCFDRARSFARGLRLSSSVDWRGWVKGERPGLPARPREVPTRPEQHYPEWEGWQDWLGRSYVGRQPRRMPFPQAQDFVQKLGLRSVREWRAWCRGDRQDLPARPHRLPVSPEQAYSEWTSWGEFLGTGTLHWSKRTVWSFRRARAFVRMLGLKGEREWRAWCAGLRPDLPARPATVPTNPHRSYPEEWEGIRDWLGT